MHGAVGCAVLCVLRPHHAMLPRPTADVVPPPPLLSRCGTLVRLPALERGVEGGQVGRARHGQAGRVAACRRRWT